MLMASGACQYSRVPVPRYPLPQVMNDLDQTLKRLLDAEDRARSLVDEAQAEQARILDEAREQAREDERQFEKRMEALRTSLASQAEQEAERHIGELQRRFDERSRELRNLAVAHHEAAIDLAISVVVGTERR